MSVTATEIKTALEAILATHYKDGEERQERDGSTWGWPGGHALREPNPDESAADYLAAMIVGIEDESYFLILMGWCIRSLMHHCLPAGQKWRQRLAAVIFIFQPLGC